MPVAFSRFLAVLPLHNIHMVPVFPGRQTETPRFRLAVTTAITTSWLGVDRSGLPTTSDCSASQGGKAASTENWRGMMESNQHLRRGKKRKAIQLAPYNNAACAPVFPGCHSLCSVCRVALRQTLTLSLGAACWNRTSTSGGGRKRKPSGLHLTTMPHVCPSFRAAISALLNFI